MIEIRDASGHDIPAIQELAEEIWWVVYPSIIEREQIAFMLGTIYSTGTMQKSMRDGSQTFLLLSEDNVPKGFASYGTWPDDPALWKVHKLYILPDCQGRGFGRMLLDEIRARANRAGVPGITLNVNRNNPAFHFYLRYGFSVLREEDIPIGEFWMNDFVMKISLQIGSEQAN